MSRRNRLPVQHQRPPRPTFIVDPAMTAELEQWRLLATDPAGLIRQQQRNSELYLKWKIRQEEINERDAKYRRFWTSFGAVIGLAFLAGVITAGWLLWTVVGLGVLAVPLVLGAGALAAAGGHRCITIVQHMH
jgi:hypothetical protein